MTSLLEFMAAWTVRTSLIVLLAAFAGGLLQRLSAHSRHFIWRCALAASVLVGLGMLLTPAAGLSAQIQMPAIAATLSPNVQPVLTRLSPVNEIDSATSATASSDHVEAVSSDGLLTWKLAVVAYLLGLVLTLVRWGASLRRTLAICRSARPADGYDDVFIAGPPELTVPFTLGWRKPVIVLPANSVGWSQQRLGAVLLHERSHVKRRDWIWQSAATIVVAFQWFNPAAWLLAARLKATAEEAAENDVLAAGITPSVYARELIMLAAACQGLELATTAVVGRKNMVMRLRFILAANRTRKPAKRSFVVATASTFGLVGLALATCAAVPMSPSAFVGSMFQAEGTATFSDGAKVTILYVGPAESSTLPVWHFDGSPAGTAESITPSSKYTASGAERGKRGLQIGYTIVGMPPRDRDADPFRVLLARLGNVDATGGGSGGSDFIVANSHFLVSAKWTQADFQVGRGMGKYQQIADNRAGERPLEFKVLPNGQAEEMHRENGKEVRTKHPASKIKFTIPRSVKGKDWLVRAFDAAGKPVRIFVTTMFDPKMLDPREGEAMCNSTPETIQRVVLESRDYEWVTIKNLHLRSNPVDNHK